MSGRSPHDHKVHLGAHTLEDGWAVPECRKGRLDAEQARATLDPAEVTCGACLAAMARGGRPGRRAEQRARTKAAGKTDGRQAW